MIDDAVIPTADAILRPALEKMYALRPNSFRHINLRSGVYWHPFLAYRSQAAKMVQRLAGLHKNNTLQAEGDELIEYVASEYDAVPQTTETTVFAIGEVVFTRTTSAVQCDVPKGTRLTRAANLETQIPLPPAIYETLTDVRFDIGQTTSASVPIRAVNAGSAANHPIRSDAVAHGVTLGLDRVRDKTVVVSTFSAAGGSDKASDDYVRDYARAFATGQYGPTADASRYGVLQALGARNVLIYDIPESGTQKILVADGDWASSTRWAKYVQQSMYDNEIVGVGCKVDVDVIQNKVVVAEATVVLRAPDFLTETTAVDEAVRKAVKEYLDERPDWNVWNQDALKGAISRAHAKIFYCSSVTLKDTSGNTVAEILSPNELAIHYHHYLAQGAVKITYAGPT